MQMQMETDEQRMLLMAAGVVILSIVSLVLFVFQSWALFFITAVLGLLLGVYLAYGLSKSEAQKTAAAERRKRR